jgi:translation initiation factor IF-3
VRLVAPDGEQIGIRPLPEALSMARELELDLVEVADKANPPVCRIMDYGKYKYEAAQRAKESRRKSTNVVVKEMKYRPKIGHGDFDTKTRKVEKFLGEGHKVKVTIMFRGREMQHPELGKRILDEVAAEVIDTGRVEVFPKLDGRNMTMVLAPDKKAQAAKAAERKREQEAADGGPTLATDADATETAAEVLPQVTEVLPPITEIIESELDANLANDGVAELDPDEIVESAENEV